MSQPAEQSPSSKLIAWAQAFTLIVLVYSGAPGETEEQVRQQALDVIHALEAENDYKESLRTSLTIEPQERFFTMLQTE